MALSSAIEWTEATWNPVTGCTKVSPGCLHCYAERMSRRLRAMGQPNYAGGFRVCVHEHLLRTPLKWRRPRMIFVNSMGDLFHREVPPRFIRQAFQTMATAHWHHFQVLTKRARRLEELSPMLPWAPNIWMGVTVENRDYLSRLDHLRRTAAQLKFVSFEPLLGPLTELDLEGIDWVIVGGESGPGARQMKESWALDIRNRSVELGIPFFFKQWGGCNRKKAGRQLQGRTWDQMPKGATSELRNGPDVRR